MDNETAGFLQFLEEQPGIKHPWDEPSVPSNYYFNFGLTPKTWNYFVNKQVLMRYERLFIEK
jgi:hypothetical protein